MSQYYTIQSSKFDHEWTSKRGDTFYAYNLQLLSDDGEMFVCYINQKPDTHEPMEDQRIYGYIDNDPKGHAKFTRTPEEESIPMKHAHPPSKTAQIPQSTREDPERQKIIVAQNALTNATSYTVAKANLLLEIGKAKAEMFLKTLDQLSEADRLKAETIVNEYTQKAEEELTGKHVMEVQFYFAKSSMGEITLNMNPDEVSQRFGYNTTSPQEE